MSVLPKPENPLDNLAFSRPQNNQSVSISTFFIVYCKINHFQNKRVTMKIVFW